MRDFSIDLAWAKIQVAITAFGAWIGALLGGIAQVIEEDTGIHVLVAESPLDCVAVGTGKALDNLDKLRPGAIYSNAMF